MNLKVYYYRPQQSCGQGNVFTGVCHSFCSQGGSPEIPPGPGRTPPPGPGRPCPPSRENPPSPRQVGDAPRTRENPPTPPDQADPPRDQGEPPPPGRRLQHTVYERPVRILLECILVLIYRLVGITHQEENELHTTPEFRSFVAKHLDKIVERCNFTFFLGDIKT